MSTITARDVARLAEGLVEDPDECRRILAAIEANPGLAALADLLLPEDQDDDPPQLDLPHWDDLSRTRLAYLPERPEWSTWTKGEDHTADLIVAGPDGTAQIVQVKQRRVADHSVEFEANWPTGLRPIGLVLAQFKFLNQRRPLVTNVTLPPPKPQVAPVVQGRHAAPPVAAARTAEANGTRRADPSHNDWCAVANDGVARETLSLSEPVKIVASGNGATSQTVWVELVYHAASQDQPRRKSKRWPVELSNVVGDNYQMATWRPSSLPADADHHRPAQLRVWPAWYDRLLPGSCDGVSELLGTEPDFAAVPVEAVNPRCCRATFRYGFQQTAAADPGTAWLIRFAEEGGAG